MVKTIRKTITKLAEQTVSFSVQKNLKSERVRIQIVAKVNKGEKMETLTEAISSIEGVRAIKIE